ncbi:MAG TPA: hypothetical protein DEP28_03195 [Bacteroidetes bacterium]|nr:hypothetical protein [Bacteroidota bacterium]
MLINIFFLYNFFFFLFNLFFYFFLFQSDRTCIVNFRSVLITFFRNRLSNLFKFLLSFNSRNFTQLFFNRLRSHRLKIF